MRIAVQKDSGSYWRQWEREILSRGKECALVDLRSQRGYAEAIKTDGIMWHIDMRPSMQMAASCILNSLEVSTEIPLFPNRNTRWHFDDKVAQFYLLKDAGVKTPDTFVFWDEEEAIEWVNNYCCFPIIAKLKRGASSSCVYMLYKKEDALSFVRRMFSVKGVNGNSGGVKRTISRKLRDLGREVALRLPGQITRLFLEKRPALKDTWANDKGYVYFQEFIPKNTFDTRIAVIGNRAFAFRRHNRAGDFRASGSGKIDYDKERINLEMVRISHELSEKYGFQSMAYDYLLDSSGEPLLVEISYGFQSKAVQSCNGYWDRNLNWVEGNVVPEAAQVEDFLSEIHNLSL